LKKAVLAYSGGLDTSVAVKWLMERYGYQVIALTVDVGQGVDLAGIRQKALNIGVENAYTVDARDEFLREYAFRALRANAAYEGRYLLASALSRPLITRLLVETAKMEGAEAIAHGCTGKGNDQVRFDVSAAALAPDLEVIAPVREWKMTREEALDYAAAHEIPVPVGRENPYSIDANLWGRSIECGVLEDPWREPPADIYTMTVDGNDCPDTPTYVEVEFERGTPVGIDGQSLDPVDLVQEMNRLAGEQGIGRTDHVENRLVGIKSREIYEAPGSTALMTAHRALEDLTLERETAHFKRTIEDQYARLLYYGLWFSPLREALDAFVDRTQEMVTGQVRLKMHRGHLQVVGRKSPASLYDFDLATYDPGDTYRHDAAVGFIEIWGLPTRVYSRVRSAAQKEPGSREPSKPDVASGGTNES